MQKPNETLREYSYALLDLMSKIKKRDSSWMPSIINNADALSRMYDKLELTRSEDVKTLLQNFAAGTVIPGEIVSNTQTQSVETIYTEESFITFPSLSIQELRNLQKNDPVIGQFVKIWKTKVKPLTAE